jgi:hypothetical protein
MKNKKEKSFKNPKHGKIVSDYEKQKINHLEKLANKMLKDDEKNSKLKGKQIDKGFLDLF